MVLWMYNLFETSVIWKIVFMQEKDNFILPKVHGLVNIVLCCDQRRSIVIKSIIYHLDHIWYPHTCNIQRMILHSLSFNLWFLDTRGRGICWSGDRTVVWPPPTHPSTPGIHWCELPVNGGKVKNIKNKSKAKKMSYIKKRRQRCYILVRQWIINESFLWNCLRWSETE